MPALFPDHGKGKLSRRIEGSAKDAVLLARIKEAMKEIEGLHLEGENP